MNIFKKLYGVVDNYLQLGIGSTAHGIADNVNGIEAKANGNSARSNFITGQATIDDHCSNLLDLKQRVILLEFSFDGTTGIVGATIGQYGICHTSGGGYSAGEIYLATGATTGTLVPMYKMQTVFNVTTFAGTLSMNSNSMYMLSDDSPITWMTLTGSVDLASQRIIPIDANTQIEWKLNEAASPWVNSGNGGSLNLTVVPTAWDPVVMESGLFGKAPCFTGNTVLTSVPTSIGEPTGQAFTVSLWATPYYMAANSWLLLKTLTPGVWANPYVMFLLGMTNTGNLEVYLNTVNKATYSLQTTDSNRRYSMGVYRATHIAVTYDGTYLKVYVDSNLVLNVSWTGDVVKGTHGEWNVGGLGVSTITNKFEGKLEDIRIENVYRTQTEIEDIWRAGISQWI